MTSRQRIPVVATITSLLVLAGCASTVTGSAPPHSTGAPSGGTSSPSVPRAGAFPTDVAGLAALLSRGNTSIRSAHVGLRETVGSEHVTASGDELLSNGKTVAIDLTEAVGVAGTIRFRIVDAKVFAQLPDSVYASSKPWVQISATTRNSVLRGLYGAFQSAIQIDASDTARSLVAAAKHLKLDATQVLDGVEVAHYALTVDIASLPGNLPGRESIQASGLTSIPVEIYVDAHGRTRKVLEDFTVAKQRVTVDMSLTKIDEPVKITAPPPDQVEHA